MLGPSDATDRLIRDGALFRRGRTLVPPRWAVGLPVYDAVPQVPGFLVAVGHSGITLAAITAQVFLDLVTKGRTDLPIAPYSLSRLTTAQLAWPGCASR